MAERVIADDSVLLRKHIMLALGELMGFVYIHTHTHTHKHKHTHTHTHTHTLPPSVPLHVSPFHSVCLSPSLAALARHEDGTVDLALAEQLGLNEVLRERSICVQECIATRKLAKALLHRLQIAAPPPPPTAASAVSSRPLTRH